MQKSFISTVSGAFARSFLDLFKEKIFYRCATISYFALTLIFPLFIVIATLSSFLPVDSNTISVFAEKYFPGSAVDFVKLIERLANQRITYGLVSLLLSYVFASNFFNILSNSLSEVIEVKHKSWKHKLLTQFLAIPLFFIAVLLIYLSSVLIGLLYNLLDGLNLFAELIALLPDGFPGISTVITFVSFYLFSLFVYEYLAPRSSNKRFVNSLAVSFIVSLIFIISKKIFIISFIRMVKVNPLYGTFSGVLGFLLWIYVTSAIILFGGRMFYYLETSARTE